MKIHVNNNLSIAMRRKFAFWRNWNFFMLFFAYTIYYLVKYAYKKEYGDNSLITAAEFGAMAMTFNMTYGISKFISGNIVDRVNARWFIAIGLLFTSIFNMISGAFTNVIFITLALAFVAWFQGFGITSTSKIFSVWFVKKERGTKFGLWNASHNIGGGLAPLLIIPFAFIPLSIGQGSFSRMFLISAIGIISSVILFFALKETPKAANLPSVQKYLNVRKELIDWNDHGIKSSYKNNLLTVLRNKWLIIFCVGFAAISVLRFGIGDFMFKYISQHHHISKKSQFGNMMFLTYEFSGIPAAIFTGMFTDWRVRKGGSRTMTLVVASLACIIGVLLLWIAPVGNKTIIFIAVSITSWCVWMIISLGITSTQDLSAKRTIGTAIGLNGITAYLAGAIIGDMLGGVIITYMGWTPFFILMILMSIIGALSFAYMLREPKDKHENTPRIVEKHLLNKDAYTKK